MAFDIGKIEQEGAPISFVGVGSAKVRTSAHSAKAFTGNKIPLDGRRYICAGTIILKNGYKLRANFELDTGRKELLDEDTLVVYLNNKRTWHYLHDKALFESLQITKDEALPFDWFSDIPVESRRHYIMGFLRTIWNYIQNA